MKTQTNSNWQKQLLVAAIATVVFIIGASSFATAQDQNQTYVVGQSIEVKGGNMKKNGSI